MYGSLNFFLHLIAFGLVAGVIIPSFILDRKLRAEQDWGRKLYIGGIMRSLGAIAPYNIALLIITGIGNMYNRTLGFSYPWYEEEWLVIKLACFLVLAINGLFVVSNIGKKRAMIIKSVVDKSDKGDAKEKYESYNKKISLLFLIQTTLLLIILFLSAFGSGKHPGEF
jgi:hypothetical protein